MSQSQSDMSIHIPTHLLLVHRVTYWSDLNGNSVKHTYIANLTQKHQKALNSSYSLATSLLLQELLFTHALIFWWLGPQYKRPACLGESRTSRKTIRLLMCQIANSRNFSGIWRRCVTSSLRINQIVYLGCFSHFETFWHCFRS